MHTHANPMLIQCKTRFENRVLHGLCIGFEHGLRTGFCMDSAWILHEVTWVLHGLWSHLACVRVRGILLCGMLWRMLGTPLSSATSSDSVPVNFWLKFLLVEVRLRCSVH
ncbi:hypothetical protein Y032_0239g3314 [Ancylostoma ceylanicum]|uniref:Uncharacterized protein n=1 Tax=Ancylostoma ceylanicum TaxID=53326 RepID=A0A016SEY3_9BILA|nr:hypothetical protein Y032_0239g3314 [Ancylostoma ceylanicum]